jgi:hypothetical protein
MSKEPESIVDLDGFCAVINSRLAANARVAKATAFGRLCGGAAIAFCLSGLGVAVALYGYSQMVSAQPAAEQTANALVAAFNRAEINANVTGNMSLSPDSEIKLREGQTVKIEEGATVSLDPTSSIRVVGDLKIDIPRPSQQQLQLETTSKSNDVPFTSYTIFKSVSFQTGTVETGWDFELANPTQPRLQFCKFIQPVGKGTSTSFILAVNAAPRRSTSTKFPFNFDQALANCIWFSGS